MGRCSLRVERVGADTALAGIAALVGRAHAARPRLQVAGELAAGRFVARVLALTALTATAWAVVDPARAFAAAIAVLVISCPCAFALAVPAALTRALGALARRGVLVVKPDAHPGAGRVHACVVRQDRHADRSHAVAGDVQTFGGVSRDDALAHGRDARAPEPSSGCARHRRRASGHRRAPPCRDVATHAGLGVSATIDGRALRLGRGDFALAGKPLAREYDDAVLLADDRRADRRLSRERATAARCLRRDRCTAGARA